MLNALQHAGFEVITAESGWEALRILRTDRPFDVIITDVNMPKMNGLEVIRSVRMSEARKATPIIIISTDGKETDRAKAMNLGANAYVTKPIDPEQLVSTIKSYLPSDAAPAPEKASS